MLNLENCPFHYIIKIIKKRREYAANRITESTVPNLESLQFCRTHRFFFCLCHSHKYCQRYVNENVKGDWASTRSRDKRMGRRRNGEDRQPVVIQDAQRAIFARENVRVKMARIFLENNSAKRCRMAELRRMEEKKSRM